MPALAKLLPSTSVASKSCGSDSRRLMILPARGRARLQLPHLPFAQREEGGFRQREEETGAGETSRAANARIGVIPASIGRKAEGKAQNARNLGPVPAGS